MEPERRVELRSTSLTAICMILGCGSEELKQAWLFSHLAREFGITLKRVWSSALAKSRGSRARTIAFKENLVADVEHLRLNCVRPLSHSAELNQFRSALAKSRGSCYSVELDPTYIGLKPSLMWG